MSENDVSLEPDEDKQKICSEFNEIETGHSIDPSESSGLKYQKLWKIVNSKSSNFCEESDVVDKPVKLKTTVPKKEKRDASINCLSEYYTEADLYYLKRALILNSQYELDLTDVHFKNIGEVAAAALLTERLKRLSLTHDDLQLGRYRRNAAVLSDGKMVVLYHQQLKKKRSNRSLSKKSTSGLSTSLDEPE
ncbi:unnamed protein product [Brachionus calyciflorus]|uniref:Uncharacterized protein n=1 Tax=Brachionus calyciflorus TaxID=104777 RepID=A0A813NWR4_9BILA|nr:unnamed protein product [Brachionus calyciflorus]